MLRLPGRQRRGRRHHVGGDVRPLLTTRFRRRLSPCCVASKLARVRVDVIPEKLFMRVEAHEIPSRHGPMACWSYVSDGLTALGQTEIVFTLRQDPAASRDRKSVV